MSQQDPAWWHSAVIYQVYIRSFADSSGDGVGDIGGLRAHVDHIRDLGADAIWISPWFASPMVDHGYDISDYRRIDPLFGSLDQAEALIEEAHRAGLRVILDLVANHTSDQHPWFRHALDSADGAPPRARYFFRDGRGAAGELPPNDWNSAFGGPAWTRSRTPDGRPGQWYLHLFAPQQPDLDWSHPEVRAEFVAILRFWFDRGVDGMRIDAASAFAKAEGLPDFGLVPADGFRVDEWRDSPMWDVPEVHDVHRLLRRVADEYDPPRMLIGEVVAATPSRFADYLRPDELHTAFNIPLVKQPWSAPAFRAVIDRTLESLALHGAPATWVLSSHDETRTATRLRPTGRPGAPGAYVLDEGVRDEGVPHRTALGGGALEEIGVRRARAALLLILALPGNVSLYQGEELGLPEVWIPDALIQDPVFVRSDGQVRGRDGCRVPLPWSGAAPPYGFTTGPRTWLPQPTDWTGLTVQAQSDDADSTLQMCRAAVRLRRSRFGTDGHAWLPAAPGVLHLLRGSTSCLVNMSGEPVALPGSPLLVSGPHPHGELPPDTAAWLAR